MKWGNGGLDKHVNLISKTENEFILKLYLIRIKDKNRHIIQFSNQFI